MPMVWPSGADFATASVPMLVPAPGLFSTITLVFQTSPSFCAITRPTMSVGPPGGNGTISLTTPLGYSCACAIPAARQNSRTIRIHAFMSIRLYAGILPHAAPEFRVFGDEGRVLLRRFRGCDFGAAILQRLRDRGVGRGDSRGVEHFFHDVPRRARGKEEAVPERNLVVG